MSNGEQLLSAGLGAFIGFWIGGPAGAYYGFQAGLLAGTALFPTQLEGVTGPRLQDTERAEASPGAIVALGWGEFPVAGFRLYLGPRDEVSNTEEVGGKGAPEQDVTTFAYFQTIALGLCEGVITGVRRIWENGELKYDAREQLDGESDDTYNARISMSAEYALHFVLYLGTDVQTEDPTMEAEKGLGNVPGYRGLAYIVYPNRQLKSEQANRHPSFKFEIGDMVTGNPPPVIDHYSPADTPAEKIGVTLHIIGASFFPTSRVFDQDDNEYAATYVSGSELTIDLPDALVAAPDTVTFRVENPIPGGGPSNEVDFEITDDPWSIGPLQLPPDLFVGPLGGGSADCTFGSVIIHTTDITDGTGMGEVIWDPVGGWSDGLSASLDIDYFYHVDSHSGGGTLATGAVGPDFDTWIPNNGVTLAGIGTPGNAIVRVKFRHRTTLQLLGIMVLKLQISG